MKSNLAVIAATFTSAVAVVAQAASSDCNNSYTKFPDGKTTYSIDDGGCFFCAQSPIFPGSTFPLSGQDLAENCKRMCNSDPQCVSFSVGRPAVLPAHEHYFGKQANCCLERQDYPPGAFVDATKEKEAENNCHLDAMCWTRYEKNKKGQEGSIASQQQCHEDGGVYSPPTTPSDQCSVVWKENPYSDEELQAKIDFIQGGCDYNDTKFETMLAKAYSTCKAEAYAESIAISIILHSSAMYTYVSVDL